MSDIKIVYLWIPKEDKFHIWHPNFINTCYLIPKASNNMYVHNHHKYKINNFIKGFSFLTSIQIYDYVAYSV